MNQPPIPLSLSKCLVERSLRNRENYRRLQSLSYHLGEDHLSRLHTSITANKGFSVGSRQTQTTLARVSASWTLITQRTRGPICCNKSTMPMWTIVRDYSALPYMYDIQREALRYQLSNVLVPDIPLTEAVPLGSANSPINRALYPSVAKATIDFVWRRERKR